MPPHLVAIKKLKLLHSVSFDAKQQALVGSLLKLRHENICQFKGLVLLSLRNVAFRISEYCSKGSLHDLLKTSLDLAFDMRLCLTKDLINGMVYINKSPIGYHGRLSSKNCLIDGHFKLKISDIETILTSVVIRNQFDICMIFNYFFKLI